MADKDDYLSEDTGWLSTWEEWKEAEQLLKDWQENVLATMYGFYGTPPGGPTSPPPKSPSCPPPPAACYAGFVVGETTTYSNQLLPYSFQLVLPGSTTMGTDWVWEPQSASWVQCGEEVLLLESARVHIRSHESIYNAGTVQASKAEPKDERTPEEIEKAKQMKFFFGIGKG